MMMSLIIILIALSIRVGVGLYLVIKDLRIIDLSKEKFWFYAIFLVVLLNEILPLLSFIAVGYFQWYKHS